MASSTGSMLDELLVGLGFEYDPEDLATFKSDIDKTSKLIGKLIKVSSLAATAITGMVVASTKASDEQGKLADEIGETVETIDALQFALTRSGGSSEGMSNTLQQLAIRASEAARGIGTGVEAFGILGVSVNDANGEIKTTEELLLEISKEFQGLSNLQQIELADKLGVKDSIRLLQQGPAAIRELTNEAKLLGVTTAEDAEIAAEFQDSLTDMWQIVKEISRTLTRSFAPAMIELRNLFKNWWIDNRAIIEQNLPKYIDTAAKAIKVLAIAAGAFIAFRLVGHLLTLASALKGITTATLAANAAAFLLPALIAAGVTAFAVLAQDAKVFFEGGESFIGDMIKKFPEWESQIISVAAAFATLGKLIGMAVEGWKLIFTDGPDVIRSMLTELDTFIQKSEVLSGVFTAISDTIKLILDGWSNIAEVASGFSLDSVTGVLKNIPGFLGDVTGLKTLDGDGLFDKNTSNSVSVGEIVIEYTGTGDSTTDATLLANQFKNEISQASRDLTNPVVQ